MFIRLEILFTIREFWGINIYGSLIIASGLAGHFQWLLSIIFSDISILNVFFMFSLKLNSK